MAFTIVAPGSISQGDWVAGFIDLSGHARMFYSATATPGPSVAFPTATVAPTRVGYPTVGAANGPWTLQLTMAVGAPDGGSPAYFVLDQRAMVIKSSAATDATWPVEGGDS